MLFCTGKYLIVSPNVVQIVSELPQLTDPLGLILYLIVPGGLATGLVGYLQNRWTSERQERVSLATFRMERISARVSDYMRYQKSCKSLFNDLKELMENPGQLGDKEFLIHLFYNYQRFIHFGKAVFLTNAGIILTDQDGETVIAQLNNVAIKSPMVYSKMEMADLFTLLDENSSSADLKRLIEHKVNSADIFFDKFEKWIIS